MRVYLAGTVTGTRHKGIIDQSYRQRLTEILQKRYPNLEIDDPQIDYKDGLKFEPDMVPTAFMDCVFRALSADVVIAYLPEVSMGTAVEMYAAFNAGKDVFAITTFQKNWAVVTTADRAFRNIEEFERCVEAGVMDAVFCKVKPVEYASQHCKKSYTQKGKK